MQVAGPLQIPGVAEAVSKEQLFRDAAFLPVKESIGAFEVKPLCLFHFLVLRIAGSAFLPPFTTPTPEDLAIFLWVVNPAYSPCQSARRRFQKRCRGFKKDLALAAQLTAKARDWIEVALLDRPEGGNSGYSPDYFSSICTYSHVMRSEYGYSMEQTLHMPMRILFQICRELNQRTTPSNELRLKNRLSDGLISDFLKQANESIPKGRWN